VLEFAALTQLKPIFGKIVKWVFILFNRLMIIWVCSAINAIEDVISNVFSGAEQAGTAISSRLRFMMPGSVRVAGNIIIGIIVLLLTSPKN
jgi:hypothetical protein